MKKERKKKEMKIEAKCFNTQKRMILQLTGRRRRRKEMGIILTH